eukprot:15441283-Alexandrium_andersonii.AAC.1
MNTRPQAEEVRAAPVLHRRTEQPDLEKQCARSGRCENQPSVFQNKARRTGHSASEQKQPESSGDTSEATERVNGTPDSVLSQGGVQHYPGEQQRHADALPRLSGGLTARPRLEGLLLKLKNLRENANEDARQHDQQVSTLVSKLKLTKERLAAVQRTIPRLKDAARHLECLRRQTPSQKQMKRHIEELEQQESKAKEGYTVAAEAVRQLQECQSCTDADVRDGLIREEKRLEE